MSMPLFCCGIGDAKENFERNLQDELRINSSINVVNLDENQINEYFVLYSEQPSILTGVDLLMVKLTYKAINDSLIQSILMNLINHDSCRVYIFSDNINVISSILYDYRNLGICICCDQRSYSNLSYSGSDLLTERKVAVFRPGEDNPIFISIPTV